MSAWQVSDAHIVLLAAGSHPTYTNAVDLDELNRRAKVLFDANQKSLQARYGDEPSDRTPRAVVHGDIAWVQGLPAVVVLKQANCYAYQACEFDGWEKSEARRIVETVKANAINRLPGYDDAPWGIDEPTHTVMRLV